jgi:uncharacterized protein (DUF983 family)
MLKNSLYSIFKYKCPRCNRGEFFESRNPYNLKEAGNIKESCSHCKLKYSPEPGFYYGAMYVSYGLGIAMFVTVWVALLVLYPSYTPIELIILLFISLILLGPYIYALSKTVWANLFFHYEEEYAQEKQKEINNATEVKR